MNHSPDADPPELAMLREAIADIEVITPRNREDQRTIKIRLKDAGSSGACIYRILNDHFEQVGMQPFSSAVGNYCIAFMIPAPMTATQRMALRALGTLSTSFLSR